MTTAYSNLSTPSPENEYVAQLDDIGASRANALRELELSAITTLDAMETVKAQRLLHHGSNLGVWHTPPGWVPSGKARIRPDIDIHKRISQFIPEFLYSALGGESSPLLSRATLVATHYAILLRMGPSGTGRAAGRPLKPNPIFDIVYSYLPRLMAAGVRTVAERHQRDTGGWKGLNEYGGPLLESVNLKALDGLSASSKQHVLKECQRMHMLNALGLWQDTPSLDESSKTDLLHGSARFNPVEGAKNPHLPLPDYYVSLLGQRCLWLIQDLAPNLFALELQLNDLWLRTLEHGWVGVTVRDKRRYAVRCILAQYEWRDSAGHPFKAPPFPLTLPKAKGFGKTEDTVNDSEGQGRWPPRTHIDFMCLVGMVQMAHMCVALLATGGRHSELLSLNRNCIERAIDGVQYANGKTFKLVERFDGEGRDWQLPDVAVTALEQQGRLVAMGEWLGLLTPLEKSVTDSPKTHMWAQLSGSPNSSDPTQPLSDINKSLVGFTRGIGLEIEPGGQRIRAHRFRKTLARLVALALTQAPRILMDVFGHKSLEMTLYYILSDKNLRVEIETVTRELRVMRAKEVIEKMVEDDLQTATVPNAALGGYGGLAAVSVRRAIDVHRRRVYRRGEDWDTNSVYELADLLTLQGKAWDHVREGVICTKFVGEAGPCNKSKGRPEPSKCQSSCVHRLEEAFLQEDLDASIREALAFYEQALADEEGLTASHWAAQIRMHVTRFADLRSKWMLNATVQTLLGNEIEEVAR